MSQVRWRAILLLFWLTIFFNIERLDIDIDNIDNINLPTIIYIVGIFVSIASLTPFFQRYSVWVLITIGVSIYIAALLIMQKPVFGDGYMYLTLTGIFMLLITALLSYNLGKSLEEFVAAVSEMTFSDKGGRLRNAAEAQEFVDIEMATSRRKQRSLSLVLLQGDPSSMNMTMHRLIQDIQRSMMQRYLMATIARVLTRYLRRTDIIIEGEKPGRLVLIAPETDTKEAEMLGVRLQQIAQDRLGVTANYSVATFPDQALTYEELVNVAEQRLNDEGPGSTNLPDEQFDGRAKPHAQDAIAAPTAVQPEG